LRAINGSGKCSASRDRPVSIVAPLQRTEPRVDAPAHDEPTFSSVVRNIFVDPNTFPRRYFATSS